MREPGIKGSIVAVTFSSLGFSTTMFTLTSILVAALSLSAGTSALASAVPRAGPYAPCELWIPQFGVNTVFIKGQETTVTW